MINTRNRGANENNNNTNNPPPPPTIEQMLIMQAQMLQQSGGYLRHLHDGCFDNGDGWLLCLLTTGMAVSG
jgi:hypothetical protein